MNPLNHFGIKTDKYSKCLIWNSGHDRHGNFIEKTEDSARCEGCNKNTRHALQVVNKDRAVSLCTECGHKRQVPVHKGSSETINL